MYSKALVEGQSIEWAVAKFEIGQGAFISLSTSTNGEIACEMKK